MSPIKTCAKTGAKFIQFKTANPITCKDSVQYMSKVITKVMKESVEFTGVDITTVFRKPNGHFKLYGRCYFVNGEDQIFYWTGVDTENSKGWSLRIVQLTDEQAQVAFASHDIKFDLLYDSGE